MIVNDNSPTPGPADLSKTLLMNPGTDKDSASGTSLHCSNSTKVQMKKSEGKNANRLTVIHLSQIPFVTDYDDISKNFETFGNIKEIRLSG